MLTHLARTKHLGCCTMEIYGTINKILSEAMHEMGNGDWGPPIYPGKLVDSNLRRDSTSTAE